MLFVQHIRNPWRNKKPPTHQGGGFNPPAEIYLVSFPTTHRRELSFPITGTLALHCQVARLVFESFLMLLGIVSSRAAKGNNNLCHSKNSRRNVNWTTRHGRFIR
jgi:hypothetical protein